jgi:predicted membrane protein
MAELPDDPHPGIEQDAREAARNAAYAARHAARAVRRAHFRARCDGTPWFFGSVLIVLGLLFLLDNLHVIEARFVFRNLWPLMIIAFGVSRLMFGIGGERVFGAIATTFGGLWLGQRLFDWQINVVGVFWPIILIGLGISLLFRRRPTWSYRPPDAGPPIPGAPGAPPHTPMSGFAESDGAAPVFDETVDQSATVREVAIMAGVERRNVSQTFKGGTITAVMGSVEMDLRDCRMADEGASLWVQAILGQVVLRLPPNWTVDSRLAAVLGNLEDRSDRPIDAAPKRLIIEGSAFMGQVEIRN